MKTHSTLLTDFRRVTKNPGVSAGDLDYYVNLVQPTFLRQLSGHGLIRSHLQYLPKLKLTLTNNQWQYSWLDVAKYTNAATSDTAGVITLAAAKSTYFLAPGDLATYNAIDYTIVDVAAGTFTLGTSVGASTVQLDVYARPLFFTDAFLLKSTGTSGQDEVMVRRFSEMQTPTRDNQLGYRLNSDKIEIGWNPTSGDILHLFYVPTPVKFDNGNALMTALANPTQLTDEATDALIWTAGKAYWTQKGMADEVVSCKAVVDEIMGTAGFSKGQTEW
jgi:hypothetical protein